MSPLSLAFCQFAAPAAGEVVASWLKDSKVLLGLIFMRTELTMQSQTLNCFDGEDFKTVKKEDILQSRVHFFLP